MKKRLISLALIMLILLSLLSPALAASRTFRVYSSVEMNSKGYVEISWTDSSNRAPYEVDYMCTDGTAKQTNYIGATNVSTNRCELNNLCPGKHYKITVVDKYGDTATARITVPRRQDVTSSRPRVGSLEFRYKTDRYAADSAARRLNTLSASAIERNLRKGYVYGFFHKMQYYKKVQKVNVHNAVFAVIAPNGYICTNYATRYTLPRQGSWQYDFLCDQFFTNMYEANGYIATGEYEFYVFLEGRCFYSARFSVV